MTLTLGELADKIGAELYGDTQAVIHGVATLQDAQPGEITFLVGNRYRKQLAHTHATAVILSAADQGNCPVHTLVVDNPAVSYAHAATLLHPPSAPTAGIHPSAIIHKSSTIHATAAIGAQCVIDAGAQIAAGVIVGAGCIIGENAVIGEDSRLEARVTVCYGTQIGRRALIHPGAVIGSDGFGLANDRGTWLKIPQLGKVRIGDDVEIGANTTIDRGALDDTVIEDGVKLDNQIQVAHNVRIGAHTAIAGCVGIAGSAKIGRRCTIGGGVGVAGHLEIADDVHITGMTLVSKSILTPGIYSSGLPAQPNQLWNKIFARLCQLDDTVRRLKILEKNINNQNSDDQKI
ncbi:MAG: UDP-3-O-(3-hydroxymyristoyl)glucosamine N-acyltransferase [Gammaproteobacteria bacterium]